MHQLYHHGCNGTEYSNITTLEDYGRVNNTEWKARYAHPNPHNNAYYAQCFAGGVLSSSIRWIKTPLDNVKCNMQVNPLRYPTFSAGLRTIWREGGISALYRGLLPTVLAYSSQSGTKYFMYEILKDQFATIVGEQKAHEYRGIVYITAAACAEGIADVLMCPWEMLKVQVQTSSNFPTRFTPALTAMIQQRAILQFPFGSLVPLWNRQVIGTVTNFYIFESTVECIYKYVLRDRKDAFSVSTQLAVTFTSGYVAGLLATIVSHPADSLISLRAKPEFQGLSLIEIQRHVGWKTLATQGLGPRVAMTGTIIAYQWLVYDAFKSALGMGTTGGERATHRP